MQEVKSKIKEYLDKRAAEDALFATSYAKESKSLDECIRFIMGEAAKVAVVCPGGKGAFMSDEWVYGQAVHYYDEDDIKVEPIRGRATVSTDTNDDEPEGEREAAPVKVRLSKKDREVAKKVAMERLIDEERQKLSTPRKKCHTKPEVSTQMTLFA